MNVNGKLCNSTCLSPIGMSYYELGKVIGKRRDTYEAKGSRDQL